MRALLIFIFFGFILHASDNTNHLKAQILEKIFLNIFINDKITIWSDNKELLSEFKKSSGLIITDGCEKATIIVIENKENIKKEECQGKPIFVLNYNHLSDLSSSFGALFWKKGRPNIVIIAPRIKSQNITISKELNTYLEEKIW